MDYQRARLEAFQSANPNIQNSFAASVLVPLDADGVFNRLNMSLRTPSPTSSRPSSRSSQFVPETPGTVAQLHKQSSMMNRLLDRRSKRPPSTLNLMVNQTIQWQYLSLHALALLMQDNLNLRRANGKAVKNRTRAVIHLLCEEDCASKRPKS